MMSDIRALRIKEHIVNRKVHPTPEQISKSNHLLSDDDFEITIDLHRFIVSSLNTPNKLYPKVMLMGDSIAECAFVPEGLRITDVLNAFVSDNSMLNPYEFLNAACSGNTTFHMIVVYLAKLMPLNPKHVIALMGSIDAGACRSSYNYWTPLKGTTPFTYTHEFKKFPRKLNVDFSYREALLIGLDSMCKAMGTHFHIATMPITPIASWHKEKNISDIHEIVNLRRELNDNSRYISKKHNLSLIDLETSLPLDENLFYDIAHLSQYGAKLVAEAIREYLNTFDLIE